MKIFVLSLIVAVTSTSIYSQGTVFFSNVGLHGRANVQDACRNDVPAGTMIVAGLYFAPDGVTDESQFVQIGPTASFVAPGLYDGGVVTAPITTPGFFGMFQVRVWESAFGATYEEAIDKCTPIRCAFVGRSSIIRVDTGDPTKMPPGTPASLKGISGIILEGDFCIPEPSTDVLGLFGAAIFFFLRMAKIRL